MRTRPYGVRKHTRRRVGKMTILALDSSTEVCSAALLHDGKVVAERLNASGSNHAALLPLYVEQLQAIAREQGLKIEAVALSDGPGSYTGLRIGASLAKGLCYGMDIPLYTVPTLAVIAFAAISNQQSAISEEDALICPMIDARRMEVYTAVYAAVRGEGLEVREVMPLEAKIIDETSFAELLNEHTVYFCGNGAEKCKAVIKHPNARWIDGIVPTGAMAGWSCTDKTDIADVRVIKGKDIAYYEPNYLKEFVAAPAHIKGLN